jgi:hypothetical protein
MLLSVVALANVMKVRFAEDPATQLLRDGVPVGQGVPPGPGHRPAGPGDLRPLLARLLPGRRRDRDHPGARRQHRVQRLPGARLHPRSRRLPAPPTAHRGDRLAFSNGIIILAGFAIVLILAFDAEVTKLIQLYIVGVFVSFTVSQTGMVRHWTRLPARRAGPGPAARMKRSRVINAIGLSCTGTVLVVVLATKFLLGAYIAIIAIAVLFVLMRGIHKHYETVGREMAADEDDHLTLPSRVHSIVLVSKLHKPTLRALAFAKAARPYTLEAVTVDVDRNESDQLQARVGRPGHPSAAQAIGLALPRDHPTYPSVRAGHP